MDKSKKRNKDKNRDAARQPFSSDTDPLGSYTGRPADTDDKPEQDADDL